MKRPPPLTLLAISTLSVALIILFCIRFVDGNVARGIWRFTSAHPFIHNRINDISSPLPVLAATSTFVLWLAYLVMSRTTRVGRHARFIQLAATTIPAAYLIKAILQYSFGRIDTRLWLQIGGPIRFMWFNPTVGSSFPSGHTILITALLAAVWLHYPRCRLPAAALYLALAAALLLSSYHFVSDIIAGGYCGILVTIGTAHFLSKIRGTNL